MVGCAGSLSSSLQHQFWLKKLNTLLSRRCVVHNNIQGICQITQKTISISSSVLIKIALVFERHLVCCLCGHILFVSFKRRSLPPRAIGTFVVEEALPPFVASPKIQMPKALGTRPVFLPSLVLWFFIGDVCPTIRGTTIMTKDQPVLRNVQLSRSWE